MKTLTPRARGGGAVPIHHPEAARPDWWACAPPLIGLVLAQRFPRTGLPVGAEKG